MLFGKPTAFTDVENMLKSIANVSRVTAFEHFLPAWEYLEQHTVEMILLDADDETTGWQYLTERFGWAGRQTRVVLLSCNAADAVRAYEIGIFDYLIKPVKRIQLERVVGKCGND